MFDPQKYARAEIVGRRDFADDLWSLRLRADCELPFRPGQYVTIGIQIGERMIERPYSIVSSPQEDSIELFIERVPDGELSAPLHNLGVGAELAIRKRCKGLFLKEMPLEGQTHLMVATVTGIAPFVSAVRLMAAKDEEGETPPRVVILQGASQVEEFGYADELTDMAARHDWLRYIPTISRPWDNPEWEGETGRVEDVLRKHSDNEGLVPDEAGVFLCGHPQMISNARAIMRRRGFDDKAIREEQYWPD